mmetsp:Transcript_8899/g.11103  ORF Transcript_8899/g.11103 Transcript_8899/m.11103 type:complete len:176 (+) Transcript_8899:46-573(+)
MAKAKANSNINWFSTKTRKLKGSDFKKKCNACGGPFQLGKILEADNKLFHPGCFKCCHPKCGGKPIKGKFHITNKGYECKEHVSNKYGIENDLDELAGPIKKRKVGKCSKCKKFVFDIDTYVSPEHNPKLKYHVDCFLCDGCAPKKTKLAGISYATDDTTGEMFCENCVKKMQGN